MTDSRSPTAFAASVGTDTESGKPVMTEGSYLWLTLVLLTLEADEWLILFALVE